MIIKRNEDTAELVGLSFGDGGLTSRKGTSRMRFQLRGDFNEDREHYDCYIIPLFNKEVMQPIFGRNVGIVHNKNAGFYGISSEGIKIEKPLNWLGIPNGIKNELSIPKWIKESREYSFRFLRGFFDTDGSISCQRNYSIKNNQKHTQIRISLGCTSKELMLEINDLLRNFGFKTLIRQTLKQDGIRKPDTKVVLSGGIQVNRWFELIGSKNPKHISKYQIWKKFGFCPPKTTLAERMQMLKKELSPYSYYAGVSERSNEFG